MNSFSEQEAEGPGVVVVRAVRSAGKVSVGIGSSKWTWSPGVQEEHGLYPHSTTEAEWVITTAH